jgi:hypothetical protein
MYYQLMETPSFFRSACAAGVRKTRLLCILTTGGRIKEDYHVARQNIAKVSHPLAD